MLCLTTSSQQFGGREWSSGEVGVHRTQLSTVGSDCHSVWQRGNNICHLLTISSRSPRFLILSPCPFLSQFLPTTQPGRGGERRGEERRGEVDCNKCAEAGWPGPRSMLRPQSLSRRGLMVVATNTRLAASTCPALIQWNICWNKSSHDNENLNLLGWTPATREASSSTPSQTGLWTIFIPRTSLFRHVTDCGGRNKQKNILLKNTEKQWDFSDVWKFLYSCWWHQARSHERAKSPLSFFTISLTLANMTRSVQNGPVCDW